MIKQPTIIESPYIEALSSSQMADFVFPIH